MMKHMMKSLWVLIFLLFLMEGTALQGSEKIPEIRVEMEAFNLLRWGRVEKEEGVNSNGSTSVVLSPRLLSWVDVGFSLEKAGLYTVDLIWKHEGSNEIALLTEVNWGFSYELKFNHQPTWGKTSFLAEFKPGKNSVKFISETGDGSPSLDCLYIRPQILKTESR